LLRQRESTIYEIFIVLAMLGILLVIIFPVSNYRYQKSKAQCITNIRQSVIGVQLYLKDNDCKYPEFNDAWSVAIHPTPQMRNCPADGTRDDNDYGYYIWLAGRKEGDSALPSPDSLPIIADSNRALALLSNKDIAPRHKEKAIVGYADGHAALTDPSRVNINPGKL